MLVAAAASTTAGCSLVQSAAGWTFVPRHGGVLTVATAFVPEPGFWQGRPPTEGFEAGLSAALAHRLGLHRVRIVQVPFAQIVKGQLHGADLAVSQLTPTAKREHWLEFTTPYLVAPPGILARPGVEANDVHSLRQLHWVISRVSTLTPILMKEIRPERPPVVTEDRSAALKVLRAGGADALLLDLPVALGLARDDPSRFNVIGQISGGEGLAVALPAGSRNGEIVDSAIRALQANGTIGRLESRWLGESIGHIPLILTESG